MSRNVPSVIVAPRTIRLVNEAKNAPTLATRQASNGVLGVGGLEVGKTLASRRKATGMIAADANARRGQMSRHGGSGYMRANPLLKVQTATEQEKRAK